MSQRQAFHDAIAADPDSDLPRLVFADWLDENGEGRRAEFIRGQCELARLPEGDPRRAELRRLSGELFDPRWPGPHERRRGFPWQPAFQDIEFLGAIEKPEWEPCFGVRLVLGDRRFQVRGRPEGWADRLAANPRLSLVATLADEPDGYPVGPDRFAAVVGSPHLTGLRVVELHGTRIGAAGVRALAESPAGFRLTRLSLTRAIDPRGRSPAEVADAVRLIATHPAFASLQSLALHDNGLADPEVDELAESGTLPERLKLTLAEPRQTLGRDALRRLARRFDCR